MMTSLLFIVSYCLLMTTVLLFLRGAQTVTEETNLPKRRLG
jgi:hypothetical protein